MSVQRRTGLVKESHGSSRVGRTIPPVAAEFLAAQRLVVVAGERHGLIWSSVLFGEPGFVAVVAEDAIRVAATLPGVDPLAGAFAGPAEIGMLAIEPETRRRMRVNGTAHEDGDGLAVSTTQVYANCPKYIQSRAVAGTTGTVAPSRRDGEALDRPQLDWIARADTFFVGTAARGLGADVSHRGGNPGFVKAGPHRITWPDYVGNSMYMTLGNLELDPRAGLLFVDWEGGRTLHVAGRARVDWDPRRAARHPGAQRVVDLEVERVVELEDRFATRWRLEQMSRFNPPVSEV